MLKSCRIQHSFVKYLFTNTFCKRNFQQQTTLLAGHSKWANIKHIKAQKDGERATLFVKLARQIRLAIQDGGGSTDVALNYQLRNAVDLALGKNMPMSSIQGVIAKSKNSNISTKKYRVDFRYKQNVFCICILYTDNFAGLKMEMATIFRKNHATLTDVSHMFDDFGLVEATYPTPAKPLQELEDIVVSDALDCSADDVNVVDAETGNINFTCDPRQLDLVSKALSDKGYKITNAEHIFIANKEILLPPDELKAYQGFLKKLRDFPAVEDIYDNVEN